MALSETVKGSALSYRYSPSVAEILESSGLSLFVSSHQAQRVFIFAAESTTKLRALNRIFEKPTGITVSKDQLLIAERKMIWSCKPVFGLSGLEQNQVNYDCTFSPRTGFVTGDVAAHEVFAGKEDIYFVNTRFSCISKVSSQYSFIPFWQPNFIDQLLPEDRCHLNGFAWQDDTLRYVSGLGAFNSKEGWRENRATAGIVIDAVTQRIISNSLSMPHSPRLYEGRLVVLQSGLGCLGYLDPESGRFDRICELPGFLRGLSFFGHHAFVGLSKIRKDKIFQGLPLQKNHPNLECAVVVIDMRDGSIAGKIEFVHGVEELFGVEVLSGIPRPHLIGFDGDLIEQVISLPGGVLRKPARKRADRGRRD